jgi:preprotein translocase SecE subunit
VNTRTPSGVQREAGPVLSKQRYVLLVFVIAALLVGLTIQAAAVSGFAQFGMPDNRWGGIVNTSTLLAVAGGALTFTGLIRSRASVTYTTEVVGELLRVTWPSRAEALRGATTVVMTSLFVAALMAVYDLTWKNLADLVLFTER